MSTRIQDEVPEVHNTIGVEIGVTGGLGDQMLLRRQQRSDGKQRDNCIPSHFTNLLLVNEPRRVRDSTNDVSMTGTIIDKAIHGS